MLGVKLTLDKNGGMTELHRLSQFQEMSSIIQGAVYDKFEA